MPRGDRTPRGGFRERGGFERREGGRDGFERRTTSEPRMGARINYSNCAPWQCALDSREEQ